MGAEEGMKRGRRCGGKGRDWSDVATSSGALAATRGGKRQEGHPPTTTTARSLQRERHPAHIKILDFWPPDYVRIYFCCRPPSPWCSVTAAPAPRQTSLVGTPMQGAV